MPVLHRDIHHSCPLCYRGIVHPDRPICAICDRMERRRNREAGPVGNKRVRFSVTDWDYAHPPEFRHDNY